MDRKPAPRSRGALGMPGARVIGVDPSNHEWCVVIDRGRADGLRDGMAVVSLEGLVGRVIRAAAPYSKVLGAPAREVAYRP